MEMYLHPVVWLVNISMYVYINNRSHIEPYKSPNLYHYKIGNTKVNHES